MRQHNTGEKIRKMHNAEQEKSLLNMHIDSFRILEIVQITIEQHLNCF
jgi:hypothetical protein